MGTILDKVNGVEDVVLDRVEFEEKTQSDTMEKVSGGLLELVRRPTGDGDLSEYKNHPLNYDGTNEMGQVIRGFTGLLGALNYAVIDIAIGGMKIMSRKAVKGESA